MNTNQPAAMTDIAKIELDGHAKEGECLFCDKVTEVVRVTDSLGTFNQARICSKCLFRQAKIRSQVKLG